LAYLTQLASYQTMANSTIGGIGFLKQHGKIKISGNLIPFGVGGLL
jgi:hypothetical protein